MTHALLHTVIIFSTNIQRLATFYSEGLDLSSPLPEGERHLGFRLPNTYLGFDLVDEQSATYPGAVTLWLEVDDVDATYKRLLQLGATSRCGPTLHPWGALLASVLDLDGNLIGLAQRGTAG